MQGLLPSVHFLCTIVQFYERFDISSLIRPLIMDSDRPSVRKTLVGINLMQCGGRHRLVCPFFRALWQAIVRPPRCALTLLRNTHFCCKRKPTSSASSSYLKNNPIEILVKRRVQKKIQRKRKTLWHCFQRWTNECLLLILQLVTDSHHSWRKNTTFSPIVGYSYLVNSDRAPIESLAWASKSQSDIRISVHRTF